MLSDLSLRSPADGVRAAIPVVLGYLPIGFAAGVVGVRTGLSPAEIGLLSLLLFAGSAQFVFANLYAGSALTLIITVFLVNFRHFLYSTALAQQLKHFPAVARTTVGMQLTDETFSVASVLARRRPVMPSGLLTLNMTSYGAWFVGNIAGALTGEKMALGDWGADFLLIAMFAALLMLNVTAANKKTGAIVVLVMAAAVMLGLEFVHAHPLNILLAASSAAAVGAKCFGDGEKGNALAESGR